MIILQVYIKKIIHVQWNLQIMDTALLSFVVHLLYKGTFRLSFVERFLGVFYQTFHCALNIIFYLFFKQRDQGQMMILMRRSQIFSNSAISANSH